MEINREASDKIKGITLQKLRSLKLAFDTITENPKAQVHIAIEFNGDVFLYSGSRTLIEENKNYDSQNFSFASIQVLNTLVYFLDYWLRPTVAKSPNVFFSFYSTNMISKEANKGRTKTLGLKPPKKAALKLLTDYEFDTEDLIEFCSGLLLDEYKVQYKGGNFNYPIIANWDKGDWKNFFAQVRWNFDMPDHQTIIPELNISIEKYATKKNINVSGKYDLVRAVLREKIEDKQYENDIVNRFLGDTELENVFYKVANDQVPISALQYLDHDYTLLNERQKEFVQSFIKAKYNALMPGKGEPYFLKRKVKKHNGELKLRAYDLSQSSLNRTVTMDVITGEISALLSDLKPNFLFGEIGSGKSSLIGHYAISEIGLDNLCIFIPVHFLKGKIPVKHNEFIGLLDEFVNDNLLLSQQKFDFQRLLLSKYKTTLIIDGLDELSTDEVKLLIQHLEKLDRDQSCLRVIATGRPLELQALVNFNQWNCLTTLDLSESEVQELLKSEAVATGMDEISAIQDAKNRIEFLFTRKQLFSIAKTPLIICLLRDYLTDQLEEETLGSLMYKILHKRLSWDSMDTKASYGEFFQAYPNAYQREKLLAAIAYAIGISDKQTIHESQLFTILDDNVPEIPNKNQVVIEAGSFYKTVFLQQADQLYSFTSQPLFEIAFGVSLAEKISDPNFKYDIHSHNWQSLSFAVAINRIKGRLEVSREFLQEAIDLMLQNEKNTPHAATLVSESKDSKFAIYYINKLSLLSFRPLYVWSEEGTFDIIDSFSPYVIADAIYLAGDLGFNWFYEEYLNPKDPQHHSDESLISNILRNYFAIKNFQLTRNEASLIQKIIPFHDLSRTGHCGDIFSVFVLVSPESFDTDKRCRLLVPSLKQRLSSKRANELIRKEIELGNLKTVINALEVDCQIDHGNKTPAAKLWLELSIGPINSVVLKVALKAAAQGDQEIYNDLIIRFGKENFRAYLTFIALTMPDDADHAAILLYKNFSVREFHLICRPILIKSEWDKFHDTERRNILEDVLILDKQRSVIFFLNYIPFKKNKSEFPELYLYYFIRLLTLSDNVYIERFMEVVRLFPEKSVLSRYPDLRDAFKHLMERHPQYTESLRNASGILDAKLRFNANCILLACFPESSYSELENVIRSVNRRLMDEREWIRFCMKLNFDIKTLNRVADLLPHLPLISRGYALTLLYHQDYPLDKEQSAEMVNGLLGEGRFFDVDSVFRGTDGLKAVLSSDKYLPALISAFESGETGKHAEAASSLSYYHMDSLTKQQRINVHMHESQKYSRNLFSFYSFHREYFSDEEIMKKVSELAEVFKRDTGFYPRLYNLFLALSGNQDAWNALLYSFAFGEKHGEPYELEFSYRWLKTLVRDYPELSSQIGKAASETMLYPAITERKDYNTSLYQLAIMENEFGQSTTDRLKHILSNYGTQDDLTCALLFRCGDPSLPFVGDRSDPDYINYFAVNRSGVIKHFSPEEIQRFLVDARDFPSDFESGLVSELLYGNDSKEGVMAHPKSQSTALFYSILNFCREDTIDFDVILHASDQIGWPFYSRVKYSPLRDALYFIKEIQISDDTLKSKYRDTLIERIKNPEDELFNEAHEYFKELFNLAVAFPPELLPFLFNSIANHSYHLNYDFFYQIVNYVALYLREDDFKEVSLISENHIKGLINQQSNKGEHKEQTLILWMFSLISLYVDGEAREHSKIAYLMGLVKIFSFGQNDNLMDEQKQPISFSAREMLLYSLPLYEKIKPSVLQDVIKNGTVVGTNEIKSICRVLQAFNGII